MGPHPPCTYAAMGCAQWSTPEIFAGVEGAGAEEAAYATALQLEYCQLHGIDFSGGAADIFKFFDQVQRGLLYRSLEEAGMPKIILGAYKTFLEKMKVAHNTIAGWSITQPPEGSAKATRSLQACLKETRSP